MTNQTKDWGHPATAESIDRATKALVKNGIEVFVVESGEDAKHKVLELLPKNAEVMTMTSKTLESTGIAEAINNSEEYDAIKPKIAKMNRETDGRQMQRLGAAPEWAIGSVHAITEGGDVLVASGTGSQLPAYAYGADHVIWVVGSQKIVQNLEEAHLRLRNHTLPLEDARLKTVYGPNAQSRINKVITFHGEEPGRITMIIVREPHGF